LGKDLEFEAAPEPTDIIWENRQITTRSRYIRLAIAIFITLILLSISFTIIIMLKQKAMESNKKYGEANCKEVEKIY
jgi:hypothetical protein